MKYTKLGNSDLNVPHPLAGVMAQNKSSAAKEKHVWSTGDQKIGR